MVASAEIRLTEADAAQPWGAPLLAEARHALDLAAERLGLDLHGTITIRTFATTADFQQAVGFDSSHVLAAARPSTLEILIPRPAWYAAEPAAQRQGLVHEMTHLILGRRSVRPLPAWLSEGMAMLVAGEASYPDRLRLSSAGVFGTLIPLADLESNVLLGGERQHLAYAQSLSVTRFFLRRSFPGESGEGDIRLFAAAITHPVEGVQLHARLSDSLYRDSLDYQWQQQYASFWNWISFLSGASVIWLATVFLFLIVYWRKRRMAWLMRERFEREEFDDSPPIAMDDMLIEDDEEGEEEDEDEDEDEGEDEDEDEGYRYRKKRR